VPNTFTYNADNKRVQKQDSSGTSNGIWDLENILLETDQNNVTQVVYTLAPAEYGNLVSQIRGSTASYYQFDGLGSTDRLTSATLTVTDSYLYDAFGTVRTSSGVTVNPFRFVGRMGYYLNLDLIEYYVRARIFDPSQGRFISREPSGLDTNLYLYVRNSPVLCTDPSGEQEFDPSLTAEWKTRPEKTRDPETGKLYNCGGAISRIKWKIKNGGNTRGWVVQYIAMKVVVLNCDGTPHRPTKNPTDCDGGWAEAWEVKLGDVWDGYAPPKGNGQAAIDAWTTEDEGNGSKGTIWILGAAAFMRNLRIAWPENVQEGCRKYSGGLPSSTLPPQYPPGFTWNPTFLHLAKREWNCCPCPNNSPTTMWEEFYDQRDKWPIQEF
jgi:RHS repeat-associated protein